MEKPVVRRSFSRRQFFGGLGGAALIAQPLFRAHDAHAAAQPKVIVFYVGGGLSSHSWRQGLPHGTALSEATLKGGLDVFEQSEYRALKSHLTVIEGVFLKWALMGTSMVDAHGQSARCSLTASHTAKALGKVSLDRYLGSKLGATAFPSVRLKIVTGRWDHSSPSTGGSGSLSKSFAAPGDAYDGLFGKAGSATATVAQGLPLRRDVLSHSLDECKLVVTEVERQLGAAAAQRVSSHCDSLRDMERRLETQIKESATAGAAPACVTTRPAAPAATDFANLNEGVDMFQRVAANALACGRTRVVLHELWTDQPDDKMTFVKGFETMHIHPQMFHSIGTGFPSGAIMAGQIAYARFLLGKLAALMKSLADLGQLDDTLILWATNEPNGGHGYTGTAPCLYAGGGGGRFVKGKYLMTKTVSINDVFTSALRGVGIEDDRFGDDNSDRTRYGADDVMLT